MHKLYLIIVIIPFLFSSCYESEFDVIVLKENESISGTIGNNKYAFGEDDSKICYVTCSGDRGKAFDAVCPNISVTHPSQDVADLLSVSGDFCDENLNNIILCPQCNAGFNINNGNALNNEANNTKVYIYKIWRIYNDGITLYAK